VRLIAGRSHRAQAGSGGWTRTEPPVPTSPHVLLAWLQDGNYLDTLILKFLDDGDFALAEIRIGVSTMRKDTDDDDKSIRSLRAEGKIPLSEKLYRAMRKWELWRSTDNILCAR